ncbi:MAG TPA: prefoldin subunit beta, partial [Candidatus Bathyarchaeota archaeon]|nr:prefoldin subunit beta [Candidatus Bathyarchaeota archaeon]
VMSVIDFESLPEKVKEQVMRLQQLQNTLQALVLQRQSAELELRNVERAIEELEKTSDDAVVYKSAGPLLVRRDKESLVKELNERKEILNARLKVLERQEERTRERIRELQSSVQRELSSRIAG